MERVIDQGSSIVIWPQSIQEKDINDMVIKGRDVKKLIRENTFNGLKAKANFIGWKRV